MMCKLDINAEKIIYLLPSKTRDKNPFQMLKNVNVKDRIPLQKKVP